MKTDLYISYILLWFCQVASLKRQLELSQIQVTELQRDNADGKLQSEQQAVDTDVQQQSSGQSLQVSLDDRDL